MILDLKKFLNFSYLALDYRRKRGIDESFSENDVVGSSAYFTSKL